MAFQVGDSVICVLSEDSKLSLKAGRQYLVADIAGNLLYLEGEGWWNESRFVLARRKEPEVERPKHYEDMILDPLTIAAMYELTPCLTHAVKYLLRAGHKGDRLEDLDKAIRCLHV